MNAAGSINKKTWSWKRALGRAWPYAAAAVLVPLLWGLVYGRMFSVSLRTPLSSPGDLWVIFSLIKSLVAGEWFPYGGIVLQHFGAPFGPVPLSVDYPLLEQLQFLVLKGISLATSNPYLILNIYVLMGYVLAAWTMIFAVSRFRISSEIGLVLGLLFTFIIFHFIRYGHVGLAAYFFIPLAAVVLLRLWAAKPLFNIPEDGTKPWWQLDRKAWFAVCVCLLMGGWHVYYAFFFCVFLSMAGISAVLYRQNRKHLISAAILLGLVGVSVGFTMIPTIYGRILHHKNPEVASRMSVESQTYGLKMANLFIPTPDHHLNAFRRISGRYHANNPQPEGNYEYIGAVASVGLLTGLIAFFWSRNRFSTLSKFGFLLMAGLLYATVGGFSSMFAVLVTPLIRAPNRISPFLACFGLMIVGFGLQRLKTSIRNRYLWWGLIGALGVLGLADQIPSGAKYNNTAAELSSDITFVQQIEKDVSTGGAILQLPFMSFPESYPINDMADYSHLRGYLFSEKLSWSYGAVRGRPASAKIEALSREPLDLEAIRRAGYTGIYIDRFGYARHEATSEAQLIRELKQQPLESPDKRLCFFKL